MSAPTAWVAGVQDRWSWHRKLDGGERGTSTETLPALPNRRVVGRCCIHPSHYRLDMPAEAIPCIDIAPFLASPRDQPLNDAAHDVARQWREAFGRFGFAHVIGHGVPEEDIEQVYEAAKRFFALPVDDKIRDCVREGRGPTMGEGWGYRSRHFTAEGLETVSATEKVGVPTGFNLTNSEAAVRPTDVVEHLLVHRTDADLFPQAQPDLKPVAHRYFDAVQRLLQSIMEITAVAVGMPREHFEQFWGDAGCDAGGTSPHNILRLAYYRSQADAPPRPNQLRYGEHTDFQGYTILWQDHNVAGPQTSSSCVPPKGGLQVRDPLSGEFLDAPPPPKAFTVNAGDLIQCWTNDVLLSNTHRVANPPAGDATARISLVFFTGPHPDTVVECLPTCTDSERPARYAPVLAGNHLIQKLDVSLGTIDNPSMVRWSNMGPGISELDAVTGPSTF